MRDGEGSDDGGDEEELGTSAAASEDGTGVEGTAEAGGMERRALGDRVEEDTRPSVAPLSSGGIGLGVVT